MKKLLPIIAIFSLIISSVLAQADDQADIDKTIANLNAQAKTTEGKQRVLDSISKETGVPISTLQAQQSKTHFGFGELLIANSLATATGKSFDEIAGLKTSGKGWGKIAKENNVKLGEIVSKAQRANKAALHPSNKSGNTYRGNSGSHGGGPSGHPGSGGHGR